MFSGFSDIIFKEHPLLLLQFLEYCYGSIMYDNVCKLLIPNMVTTTN